MLNKAEREFTKTRRRASSFWLSVFAPLQPLQPQAVCSYNIPLHRNVSSTSPLLSNLNKIVQVEYEDNLELDTVVFHKLVNDLRSITSEGAFSRVCIGLGFLCLWASVICLAVATKEKRIWISVASVSSGIFIIWIYMGTMKPAIIERRKQSRKRKSTQHAKELLS